MNAADHPHGGGDGGRHGMARAPGTPWGQKTLGFKTRRRKSTTKFIVRIATCEQEEISYV